MAVAAILRHMGDGGGQRRRAMTGGDRLVGGRLLRELGLLCALSTLWGSSYAFIKLGVATIPPVTLIAARTVIAGLLLLAVLRLRGIRMKWSADDRRDFAVQALLNSVVPFTLIAWAQQSVDSSLATILNSTSPIFAFLLTWLVTRHEAVTVRRLFGGIAGIAGVALIVGTEALAGLGSELLAQLAIVAATVCYAGAALFGRRFGGLDPMVPAAGSLLSGAVILIPVSLIVDRPWTLAPSSLSLLALAALSIFSTAAALVLYFRLLRTLGAAGATAQSYLRVPVGVAIGVLFLGEALASTAALGLLAVVAGVAAMTLPKRSPSPVTRLPNTPSRRPGCAR